MTASLMSPDQVAETLCVSKDTVRRWAREGKLTRIRLSARVVRYRRDEVEDLIQKNSYRLGA